MKLQVAWWLASFSLLACDKPTEGGAQPSSEAPQASGVPEAAETAPADTPAPTASASADAGAASKATRAERPVPKDVTVVRMDMSEEVQMKAIGYMAAMRAPHEDDPPVDADAVEALRKKLAPLSLAFDKGTNKAALNKTEVNFGGRQIDLLMAGSCKPETPGKILTNMGGVSLYAAYSQGVLVLRCNDKSLQCLQSTRDPSDVLCTSAPRKAKR